MSDIEMMDGIETVWVTDAELIRRSGVPEKKMRDLIQFFDEHPGHGFPPKVALFGNLRHWPSVKKFFAKKSGISMLGGNERGKMAEPPLRSKVHASA